MKRVPEEGPISDSATLRTSQSPNSSLGVNLSSSNTTQNQGGASLSSLDNAEILGTSTASRQDCGGARFQNSYSRYYSYTQHSGGKSSKDTASYDPCEPGTSLSVQHPSESHRSSYYDDNLPPTPANVNDGEKRFIQKKTQSQRVSYSSRSHSQMSSLPPTPTVPNHEILLMSKSEASSWVRWIQQKMTPARRIVLSLVISLLDWISDLIVMLVWFHEGYIFWASLIFTVLVMAGCAQVSILYFKQKLRGARLILNFIGLGAFGEAILFVYFTYYDEETRRIRERKVKVRQSASISENRTIIRFFLIRGIGTVCETLPSGILQLFVAILSPSHFEAVNVASILASIIALGYGFASGLVNYPNDQIRNLVGRPKIFTCIFLLTMGDFLWRSVPIALFFASYKYPASILCAFLVYMGHFATIYNSRISNPYGPDDFSFSKLVQTLMWSIPLSFNVTLSLFFIFIWQGRELCTLRNQMLYYNCVWVFLCNICFIVLVCVEDTSKTVFTWLINSIIGCAISFSCCYIVYQEGEQARKKWPVTAQGRFQSHPAVDAAKANDLICLCW